ncbi:MAG: DUF4041 domain-containing protein [Vicinamibacterales bacterium]
MTLIVLLLAALLLVLVILWSRAERRASDLATGLDTQRATADTELGQLRHKIASLESEVTQLAKWRHIVDTETAATQLIADARARAARLEADAQAAQATAAKVAADLKTAAEQEATAIRQDARARAARDAADAAARTKDAETRAAAVIAEANRKAEEMAGDALKALRDVKELDKTAAAIENVIAGYGDRYIIPTHSLLDDLAEGFGHTEAGQQLKFVRERIREAVRTNTAATCDYVEENRRETAIRFVVDAFNGKADSILARVRQDNFGTLRQEFRDAFSIVNHNGKAFRNARIRDEYLALREEELRWATVVHELKEQEREEQRRIKEQLREEEKARREYERAMREAERDEEALRKAMGKANEQLARATEEQKAKYELQLRELEERLKAAEERSQRAVSMAQQTRRGHVYVISNVGSFGENVYKIGLTRRLDPIDRVRELGDSSVPFDFDVHALIFTEDAPSLETQLHRHFLLQQVNKVNYRKEFFRAALADIRQEIEALGLQASWTMTAAAQEYRESQAIEKKIADDPLAREAWLRRQLLVDPVSAPESAEAESLESEAAVT